MRLQMGNSEENSGIWILCGDLKELPMKNDGGGVQFNGEMADLEATYLVGKVKAKVHPFVEYFKSCKTCSKYGLLNIAIYAEKYTLEVQI